VTTLYWVWLAGAAIIGSIIRQYSWRYNASSLLHGIRYRRIEIDGRVIDVAIQSDYRHSFRRARSLGRVTDRWCCDTWAHRSTRPPTTRFPPSFFFSFFTADLQRSGATKAINTFFNTKPITFPVIIEARINRASIINARKLIVEVGN